MQRKWMILGTVLAVALPGVLAAQRTPRTPRPPRAPRAYAYSMSDHHGRIGGDARKAALVAEDLGGSFRMEMPDVPMPTFHIAPGMPGMQGFEFSFGSPWGDLELVNLNPDLGEYFGTKEGVLVVKAPGDSSLPVRSGDVILSIAGRKPTSPSHAMRILHSYEAGETVSLDIVRKQKRMTVTWKVPTREERTLMRHHEREDQSRLRLETRRRLRMRQV